VRLGSKLPPGSARVSERAAGVPGSAWHFTSCCKLLHLLTFVLAHTGGGLGAAMGAYSILSGRAWLSPVKTMALAAQSGALMGGLVTPVSPYWSETNLSGHPYQGITATGASPLSAFSRSRESGA
jgi:hypothetical protein